VPFVRARVFRLVTAGRDVGFCGSGRCTRILWGSRRGCRVGGCVFVRTRRGLGMCYGIRRGDGLWRRVLRRCVGFRRGGWRLHAGMGKWGRVRVGGGGDTVVDKDFEDGSGVFLRGCHFVRRSNNGRVVVGRCGSLGFVVRRVARMGAWRA